MTKTHTQGMSLIDCAALYGVTSLTSEVVSATIPAPTSEVTSNDDTIATISSEPTYTSPLGTTTDGAATSYPTKSICPSCAFPSHTSAPNGTVNAPDAPLQFTNAAKDLARAALPALALAAGAVLAM